MTPVIARPRRGRRRKLDPKRAVGYLRTSTDDQTLGMEAQRAALDSYARRHGLRLVATHAEHVSGAAPLEERTELLGAMEAARRHRAAVLLVAKRDRLARDHVVAALLERELERDGIAIVSCDGSGNGSGAEAELMRTILGALGQYERALIRSRTKAALAAQRARGVRSAGSIPYGNRLAADGKTLEPHPAEGPVVERIRRERDRGATFAAIVAGLNRDKVPARGKSWHMTTVQRVARR